MRGPARGIPRPPHAPAPRPRATTPSTLSRSDRRRRIGVETVGSEPLICVGEPARPCSVIRPRVPLADGATFDRRLDTERLTPISHPVRPEITRAYIRE